MRLRQGVVVFLLASGLILSLPLLRRGWEGVWESRDLSRVTLDLPPEFSEWNDPRKSLWRDEDPQRIYGDSGAHRMELQMKWVESLRASEFIKTAQKKRILITGGFDLNEEEAKVKCHRTGVALGDVCEFHEDRWTNPAYVNYDSFHAVLNRRNWNYQLYEPPVPPDKLVFFDIQESPYTLHQGDFRVNNPLLVSYWRGSDILTPYYKWWPHLNTSSTVSPERVNYARNKTKLVAMVASHCPTYNDRLGFVQELQKFIPVDVYGGCGPFKCDRTSCIKSIRREYKFYLAFENANCRDYVTEKFWVNALGGEIVPVVMGAHPSDYLGVSPPHSYIHVEDFRSARELAEYLITLDRDEDKYNTYFNWKGSGEIQGGFGDALCRVCGMLYYADFFPPRRRWPKDSWSWLKVNPCLREGEWFWRDGKYAYNYSQ